MMDDIRKRFLPRFTALAKERIRRGLKVATANDAEQAAHVARELHSLAGEAGLLGLSELLTLARRAEEAAAKLHGSPASAGGAALEQALLDLHVAVSDVERKLDGS